MFSGEKLVSDKDQLERLAELTNKGSTAHNEMLHKKFGKFLDCKSQDEVNELIGKLTRETTEGECFCFASCVVHCAPPREESDDRVVFWMSLKPNKQQGTVDNEFCYLQDHLKKIGKNEEAKLWNNK